MTDPDEPRKPGWFQRWLGADDPMDQPITADDIARQEGPDDRD